MRQTWKHYERSAAKGPMSLVLRAGVGLLAIIILGSIVGHVLGWFGEAADVAREAPQVKQVAPVVETDANGNTVEQRNILRRYELDNKLGSVKHLYVISAYSGQVLIYSTVDGKLTSSGKRLTPTTVAVGGQSLQGPRYGIPVKVQQTAQYTNEVLQDDGTYGQSIEYLYWFDAAGRYHQHYPTGGQIIHVSDQPLAVKDVVLNMEIVKPNEE